MGQEVQPYIASQGVIVRIESHAHSICRNCENRVPYHSTRRVTSQYHNLMQRL